MDEIVERQKLIITLMEQIIGRDDFQGWLKDAHKLPDNILSEWDKQKMCDLGTKDFQGCFDYVSSVIAEKMFEVAKCQKIMSFMWESFNYHCEYYLNLDPPAKHPEIIKFVEDYKKWKEKR